MSRPRGYVLVMVLFVSLVLIVSGVAYLTAQARSYQAATISIQGAQARALAEAGVEDALSKLQKDPSFPPPAEEGQTLFTYSETLTDVGTNNSVGSFQVSVDASAARAPYYIVQIRSQGSLGGGMPSHTILAEVDVCPYDRLSASKSGPNPDAYRIVNVVEEGINL